MPDENDFKFDEWANDIGLTRKTTTILREQDLVAKSALVLVSEVEMSKIGLTLGQFKVLMAAIVKFKPVIPAPTADGLHAVTASLHQLLATAPIATTSGSTQTLPGIVPNAKSLGVNLHANVTAQSSYRVDLDPLVYLANQRPEYLDIIDFVPQMGDMS